VTAIVKSARAGGEARAVARGQRKPAGELDDARRVDEYSASGTP